MEFKLPEIGEGVHEGELVSWKVKIGDTVREDQPLCEIMTDKATMEIPAPFTGKVTSLNFKEGATAKVGDSLLSYEGTAAKSTPSVAVPTAASAPTSTAHSPSPLAQSLSPAAHSSSPSVYSPSPQPAARTSASAAAPAGAVSGATSALAAPSTRRLASEMGVDLRRVRGSGPEGRVLKHDVERAARTSIPGGAPGATTRSVVPEIETRTVIKGLRKKIAEKMRLSKDRAAHFTYVEEADATALVKLRAQAKEIGAAQGVKVTYLPFVMKAMVATLKQFPTLNSTVDDEKNEIVTHGTYNIGLSIQTEDGLTAPCIKNVETKSILELSREIQSVVERARTKTLTRNDFEGSTITLTNAGSIGGLFATPIINYPEVAILGFNKIFRKPIAKTIGGRERVVIRDWTYFSISLDHRVIDGAVGAEFMNVFVKYIENPALLLLEGL